MRQESASEGVLSLALPTEFVLGWACIDGLLPTSHPLVSPRLFSSFSLNFSQLCWGCSVDLLLRLTLFDWCETDVGAVIFPVCRVTVSYLPQFR